MRTTTLPTMASKIEKQNSGLVLKEVKKVYNKTFTATTIPEDQEPTIDKLWLLSCSEIFGEDLKDNFGRSGCQ